MLPEVWVYVFEKICWLGCFSLLSHVHSKDLSAILAKVGGQNDAAQPRSKAALGVFSPFQSQKPDETQKLTKHKDLTRTHPNKNNCSQRRLDKLVNKGKGRPDFYRQEGGEPTRPRWDTYGKLPKAGKGHGDNSPGWDHQNKKENELNVKFLSPIYSFSRLWL